MDEATTKRVFELLDEEEALRRRLVERTPAVEYLIRAGEYAEHVDHGVRKIKETLSELHKNHDVDDLLRAIPDLGFLLFGTASNFLAVRDYLFNEASDLGLEDSLHPAITDWKKSAIALIIVGIRNRLQHGSAIGGCLHVESRTENHPNGAGTRVEFNLPPADWNKVVADVPAYAREEANTFVQAQVVGKENGLVVVLEEYSRSIRGIVARLKPILHSARAAEFQAVRDVVTRLKDVQAALLQHHVRDPLANARKLLEEAPNEKVLQ